MKRVAIFLVVLIVVLLVSCGNSERETAPKVVPVPSVADLQKQIDKLSQRVGQLERKQIEQERIEKERSLLEAIDRLSR